MPVYEKGSVRAEPITKMRKDEENDEEISLIAAGVDHDFKSGHRSGERCNDRGSIGCDYDYSLTGLWNH